MRAFFCGGRCGIKLAPGQTYRATVDGFEVELRGPPEAGTRGPGPRAAGRGAVPI